MEPTALLVASGIGIVALKGVDGVVRRRQRSARQEARRERQREYRAYLRSEGWKLRRGAALTRSRGFCEDCGARTSLEVHHLTYKRKGAERPRDLRALCPTCHHDRHQRSRTPLDIAVLAALRRWRIWRHRLGTGGTQG